MSPDCIRFDQRHRHGVEGRRFQLTRSAKKTRTRKKDSSQVIALDDLPRKPPGAAVGGGLGDAGMMPKISALVSPGAVPWQCPRERKTPFFDWNLFCAPPAA